MSPHITVAALVERDGLYLMVEEKTQQGIRFNQPAGHVEPGEGLQAACIREAQEETQWLIKPTALIGFYTYQSPAGAFYYRFAFEADLLNQQDTPLDSDIIAVHWLNAQEIETLGQQNRLRSPIVVDLVRDYLSGSRYPLNIIHETHLPS
jgi:8-oxo-dGTP pyrophosphatase MutT (NUDIX family)